MYAHGSETLLGVGGYGDFIPRTHPCRAVLGLHLTTSHRGPPQRAQRREASRTGDKPAVLVQPAPANTLAGGGLLLLPGERASGERPQSPAQSRHSDACSAMEKFRVAQSRDVRPQGCLSPEPPWETRGVTGPRGMLFAEGSIFHNWKRTALETTCVHR